MSTLVTQAEMLCESTIDEAGIKASDIKGVFLAGGSTRIPLVQESIKRVFLQEPISSVNVDEVVALGAALYAAYKGDQTKLSALQRNAINKIKLTESTSKCFGTISITFDELRNKEKLENSVLIYKGEKIPCSVSKSFYTTHENQQTVNCQITESTSPETDPRFVKIIWKGELELPPNRDKNQEIMITFSYDENQIMNCSFVDVSTGRKKEIDLSMRVKSNVNHNEVEKFMVE